MKKKWLIPLFLAFLVLIDHRMKSGNWYDLQDFQSHESLAIALLVLSLGMMV